MNIQIIIADAPKIEASKNDEEEETVHVELKTKDKIRNYIKGLM